MGHQQHSLECDELERIASRCPGIAAVEYAAPRRTPETSYLEDALGDAEGVFVAASDHVRAVPEQLDPWILEDFLFLELTVSRSETREPLRRHFEVDAECIVVDAVAVGKARGNWR